MRNYETLLSFSAIYRLYELATKMATHQKILIFKHTEHKHQVQKYQKKRKKKKKHSIGIHNQGQRLWVVLLTLYFFFSEGTCQEI